MTPKQEAHLRRQAEEQAQAKVRRAERDRLAALDLEWHAQHDRSLFLSQNVYAQTKLQGMDRQQASECARVHALTLSNCGVATVVKADDMTRRLTRINKDRERERSLPEWFILVRCQIVAHLIYRRRSPYVGYSEPAPELSSAVIQGLFVDYERRHRAIECLFGDAHHIWGVEEAQYLQALPAACQSPLLYEVAYKYSYQTDWSLLLRNDDRPGIAPRELCSM